MALNQSSGSESNKNYPSVENHPSIGIPRNSPARNSHDELHIMNSVNNSKENSVHKTKSIIWGDDFIFGFQDPNAPRVNCGAVLTNMPSRPNSGIWTPNPEKRGQL
ncbi:3947_t:CDS:2 [Cetraspora pellucida]|uniref:3947_t:CDS:1 n=1 Tax=Cetraspora pellucida TaxID=1433469 RepID=A0A9N9EPQ9_9GLOM|nr:3947_t:CDS:2 [Cetraspora pellucida]